MKIVYLFIIEKQIKKANKTALKRILSKEKTEFCS